MRPPRNFKELEGFIVNTSDQFDRRVNTFETRSFDIIRHSNDGKYFIGEIQSSTYVYWKLVVFSISCSLTAAVPG
jgi:hypothetical protein